MGNAVRIGIAVMALFAAACGGSEKKSDENSGGESYVAFAFSEKVRTGAFAFSQVSTKAAKDEALVECRKVTDGEKCAALGAFKSQCGAVALAGDKRITPAPGAVAYDACRASEAACAKRGGKDCVATNYSCRGGAAGYCDELSAAEIVPLDEGPGAPPTTQVADAPDPAASVLHIEFNTYSGTEGPYGAISMVASKGKAFGFIGYDEPDKETASRLALEGCREISGDGAAGCLVNVVFHNACGAVASTPEGGFGTGWGDTPALACGWAVDSCDDVNKTGCAADMYLCSPGGTSGTCDGGIQTDGDTTTLDNGLLVIKGGQKANGGD